MIRYLFIITLLFFGCKKPSERPCWKSAGETVTETREFVKLPIINVFDDVNVVFKQDSLNYIEVESYSNLISFISITNTDTAIDIKNLNKCNSLRKKDIQNTVTIHYENLSQVNLSGYGKIQFEDTIRQQSFSITSYDARSEVNLTIICQNLHCAFSEGSVVATINGASNSTYIYQSLYSIVDASKLISFNLYIGNNSTGDAHVYATNKLTAELLDAGSIYYSGTPTLEVLRDIGLGEIIAQ